MLIGIIGLPDSGKEQVINIIVDNYKDYTIIDPSKVYSTILDPNNMCCNELLKEFGNDIVDKRTKCINQFSITNILLRQPDASDKLNVIMTKHVTDTIQDLVKMSKNSLLIDLGLLLDFGLIEICDKIIIPIASSETRINRLMARSKIPYEQAYKRISIQRPITYNGDNCAYVTTDGEMDEAIIKNLLKFVAK